MTGSIPAGGQSPRHSRIGPVLWQQLLVWRQWPSLLTGAWRRSLQFRTILVAISLAAVALLGTGAFVSSGISNDLFQSRLNQILVESNRANTAAQLIFDSSDASGQTPTGSLVNSARQAITQSTSSRLVALYRTPTGSPGPATVLPFASPGLTGGVISAELREQVAGDDEAKHFWQSVELEGPAGTTVPGVVVGSVLTIPGAGDFELYLGYELSEAEQTLTFIQQILWLAGLVLTILIAVVVWFVTRLVIVPVRIAAETSERLADGELTVRIPEKGEDVLASLARSYNAMADSIESQITQLADLSLVQQRFVSDVSHELRTPLTTIRLAGDVLYDQKDSFSPVTARTAELLHTQTERFELLLSDLLEISRFDAGSAELETEPHNFAGLVDDSIDAMQSLAEKMGTELRLMAPDGHVEVEVEARRIRRIMRNLLGNAIEHGEGRPIVVSVDSSASAVAVSVRDYGIGMTEENAERVFDRFWRADPSRKRTIGGTGLGLAISLEDAVLHNGELEVWSAPGQGSCFRLTLPRIPGTPPGESPLPLPPLDASMSYRESELEATSRRAQEGSL